MYLIFAQLKLFDLDKLVNTLTGYVETRIDLLKIDVKEGLSIAITKLILGSLLSLFSFFIVFFVFLGVAALLNEVLDSAYWGYFISAGFFTLVLLVILMLREKIADKIRQQVVEMEEEVIEEENELNNV